MGYKVVVVTVLVMMCLGAANGGYGLHKGGGSLVDQRGMKVVVGLHDTVACFLVIDRHPRGAILLSRSRSRKMVFGSELEAVGLLGLWQCGGVEFGSKQGGLWAAFSIQTEAQGGCFGLLSSSGRSGVMLLWDQANRKKMAGFCVAAFLVAAVWWLQNGEEGCLLAPCSRQEEATKVWWFTGLCNVVLGCLLGPRLEELRGCFSLTVLRTRR